ncbi:LamB/YcsF family protein [Rhizobium sp. SL42]|uniref:LamB/YcsF family protein n=1 Tax=Rhizobium sp. SL42 TaxID=2806346 RepID=UPI001F1B8750|nr:5-oxoprolinase subunit PxpA [Rhizobium sp. SL42]UJW74216.1 LamB/YcsF family protein [Rhizobium sp. SL42]
MKVDLNSDMGEGFGPYRLCDDEAMMDLVSSTNIACGFHAGDPTIMTNMVRLAKARGVDVGAHPGLPDREGFGRRELPFSDAELRQQFLYQLGALIAIAKVEGVRVSHVSFHAAMGNMVNRSEALSTAMMEAIRTIDPALIVFCTAGSIIEHTAQAAGLRTLSLFLADRAYQASGALVPRGQPGDLVKDETAVRQRVRQFLIEGTVTAICGTVIPMAARSILVHSDTPGSLELAKRVRAEITAAGGEIVPVSQLLG